MPKKFKSAATVDASDLENDVFHSKRSASPQPPPKKRKAPTPPAKPSKRAKIDPKPKEPSDSSESRSENESSNEQGVRSESEEESKISDSESAQSSEGSEEAEPAKFAPQQSSQKDVDTHRSTTPQEQPSTIPAQTQATYAPPPGFEPITSLDSDHIAGDLENKQLWHIVCPASVPLSSIKELSSAQLFSEAKMKLTGDTRYTFKRTDPGAGGDTRLFIPKKDGTYKAAARSFEGTLSLQTFVHTESKERPRVERVAKEVAKQPEGLRRRYEPPGFESKAFSQPKQSTPPVPSNQRKSALERKLAVSESSTSDTESSSNSSSGRSSSSEDESFKTASQANSPKSEPASDDLGKSTLYARTKTSESNLSDLANTRRPAINGRPAKTHRETSSSDSESPDSKQNRKPATNGSSRKVRRETSISSSDSKSSDSMHNRKPANNGSAQKAQKQISTSSSDSESEDESSSSNSSEASNRADTKSHLSDAVAKKRANGVKVEGSATSGASSSEAESERDTDSSEAGSIELGSKPLKKAGVASVLASKKRPAVAKTSKSTKDAKAGKKK